MKHMAEIAA